MFRAEACRTAALILYAQFSLHTIVPLGAAMHNVAFSVPHFPYVQLVKS